MEFTLQDLHVHSFLSSCCQDPGMTPERILRQGEKAGYSALCLTDHLWDAAVPGASPWYAPQDVDHVCQALPLPASSKVPFYFGCETELPANGVPALAREHFDRFALVVVPVNHMHMKGYVRPESVDTPEKMARYVEDRLENLLLQDLPFRRMGLAHLTGHVMFMEGEETDVIRAMNENRLLRIFKGYAQAGTGIELNACAFRGWDVHRETLLSMYRIAREAGCRFYCGSDAHRVESLAGVTDFLPRVIAALGLTGEQQYQIAQDE